MPQIKITVKGYIRSEMNRIDYYVILLIWVFLNERQESILGPKQPC